VCKGGYGGTLGANNATSSGCAPCAPGYYGQKLGLTQGCAKCAGLSVNSYSAKEGASNCSLCAAPLAATPSGKACGEPCGAAVEQAGGGGCHAGPVLWNRNRLHAGQDPVLRLPVTAVANPVFQPPSLAPDPCLLLPAAPREPGTRRPGGHRQGPQLY
jgi:hypothetical protein